MKRLIGLGFLALLALEACTARDDESTPAAGVAAITLLTASCATAPPDATGTGRYYENALILPPYGTSSCPEEFLLEMDNVPPPSGGGTLVATVMPATPAAQGANAVDPLDCPHQGALIELWGSSPGGAWTYIGGSAGDGQWQAGSGLLAPGCNYGVSGFFGQRVETSLTNYTNYRVAAQVVQSGSEVPIAVSFTSGILQ